MDNKSILFFLFVLLLICPQLLWAKTCKKYGPNGQVIYYACPEPHEKHYNIVWKTEITERGNEVIRKNIVFESVCYNYNEGSIDYRGCRSEAKSHFNDKCREFKEKYNQTKSPYNLDYKIDMESFCHAASQFMP